MPLDLINRLLLGLLISLFPFSFEGKSYLLTLES
jgi:hypothetical protein